MLEGAFTSPKIRRLAVILDVPWPHALGLAGLLWRFTAKHALTGEIGRHDPEMIAAALEWRGSSDDLIDALVRCRLLDRVTPPAKLLVHDWPEHAPRYVRGNLARKNKEFSKHYERGTTDGSVEDTTDPTAERSAEITTSTSSSSSSSSSTSSNASSTKEFALKVWELWVPGRKINKKQGVASIEKSIRRLARGGMSIREAAATIAQGTKRDADRYRKEVEEKRTELKFVPLGCTYFNQDRWNDENEHIDERAVQDAGIEDQINRARAKDQDMGSELDFDSQALAELDTD